MANDWRLNVLNINYDNTEDTTMQQTTYLDDEKNWSHLHLKLYFFLAIRRIYALEILSKRWRAVINAKHRVEAFQFDTELLRVVPARRP